MTAKRKLAKKKGGKREGGTHLESFLLSSDRWKQPFPVLLIIVMKTHRSGGGSNSGKERNGRREEMKQKKRNADKQNCSRDKMANGQTCCNLPAEAGNSAKPSDANRLDKRAKRRQEGAALSLLLCCHCQQKLQRSAAAAC